MTKEKFVKLARADGRCPVSKLPMIPGDSLEDHWASHFMARVDKISLGDVADRDTIRARNAESGEIIRYGRREIAMLKRNAQVSDPASIERAAKHYCAK